eukprot:09231.XXX_554089_554235_1 [CDS] Oithona nana genome sequencing.
MNFIIRETTFLGTIFGRKVFLLLFEAFLISYPRDPRTVSVYEYMMQLK